MSNKKITTTEVEPEKLSVAQKCVLIGYPTDIWDKTNFQPLVKVGTTVTNPKKKFNEFEEFIFDSIFLPGLSGSPVFIEIVEKVMGNNAEPVYKLAGISYASPMFTARGTVEKLKIPTNADELSNFAIPNNMLMAVSINFFKDFEEILAKLSAN